MPGPPNNSTMVPGTCFAPPVQVACQGNGNVELPYGSQQYLGLGLVVFVCLVFLELFGSPFFKNAEVRASTSDGPDAHRLVYGFQ